jgi:hypothetical protein
MKIIVNISVFILLSLLGKVFLFAQTNEPKQPIDVAEIIAEARSNAKRANWHDKREYSSKLKKIFEFEGKNGKRDTELFDFVCGKRRCSKILVEHNEIPLPPEKIRKNREKLAAQLEQQGDFETVENISELEK